MTKIKVTGFFIFSISIILAFLSSYISTQHTLNNELLNTINEKKAFTQEISKNIFYIYKNKQSSTKQLDDSIKKFLANMDHQEEIFQKLSPHLVKIHSQKVAQLWNKFYLSVQKFRDATRVTTPYSNILLESVVKDIYNTNLMLIIEFNKIIEADKVYFDKNLHTYKNIQYTLFFILVLLLIYLFTQVKTVIAFIQKFLIVSKNIIKNSSIQNMQPIEIQKSDADISTATTNFNYLVQKIDRSIENASDSIEHSYKSIEEIEKHIEDLLELLCLMQEDKTRDKELNKKEDAIIQSLEELTSSAASLKNLKTDLKNLVSHNNLKK